MDKIEFENRKIQMFARIVGCAFNAYNYFHAGMDELVYEAGLIVELEQHSMRVHRQEEFPIYYNLLDFASLRNQTKNQTENRN